MTNKDRSQQAVQHKSHYCWTCGYQRKVKAVEVGHHPDNGTMLWTDIWICPNRRWYKFWHYETEDDATFYQWP